MAKAKSTFTGASVKDYIASRANDEQRKDCRELMALMKKITKQTPRMFGPSIVGYGSYRYTLRSGRSGEMPRAAFAIRGRDLVVYVIAEGREQKARLARLGKHSIGKSCLYFRRLADIDTKVLEAVIRASLPEFQRHFE